MMWLLEKFNFLNQIKDTLKTKSIVTWMVNDLPKLLSLSSKFLVKKRTW